MKRHALRRCATNLIDNALKHGVHVDVALRKNGRFVEILVDDDGPGIPENRREEAFRPFHRLDEGRNLQKGGVGLGLAIARDIARAHGGDLTLGKSDIGGFARQFCCRCKSDRLNPRSPASEIRTGFRRVSDRRRGAPPVSGEILAILEPDGNMAPLPAQAPDLST